MTIAFLTSALSPAAGGVAASVPKLAFGLSQLGVTGVHVVGVEDPSDPGAARAWGPNVHAHRATAPRAFGFARGISSTLRSLSPDVIDVQGLWNYPSLANLHHHRRHGTPYVVTPHGMLDPWALKRSAAKKWAVRLWFENEHLANAACFRATAPMEAEHFRTFGLTKPIVIVPNGVKIPSNQKYAPPQARRRLLFLSRIHPKKGIKFLLRAWAMIEAHRPEWDLILAGPDEVGHTNEMQTLAGRLGLKRVKWLSAVHGEAKSELYRSADCFVLPTHAENFGLVVAEALAHGVPVITTTNAPWKGVRDNRCGWWIELEEKALCDVLSKATALPRGQLSEMGARGRDWMVRDFGWDGIAESMFAIYQCVLHGDRLPSRLQFD